MAELTETLEEADAESEEEEPEPDPEPLLPPVAEEEKPVAVREANPEA